MHADRFSKWMEVRKSKWPNQRPMNIPFLKVPCQPFSPNWDGDPILDLVEDTSTNATSKHVLKNYNQIEYISCEPIRSAGSDPVQTVVCFNRP